MSWGCQSAGNWQPTTDGLDYISGPQTFGPIGMADFAFTYWAGF